MNVTRMTLIALAGLLLVLAGSAQDAAGYSLCGYDWTYKANPMDEDYRINPNCVDSAAGTDQEQIDAVNRSFTEWNGTGQACFEFTYGGTHSGTSVTYNGINLIYWDLTPPDGGGYIAANYHWVSGDDITESDIVCDDQNYTWNSTGTPTFSQMDVENILTHELGHTLCLDDLYSGSDTAKTMYGYSGYGETSKRTLHSDDIAGIQAIYGFCGGAVETIHVVMGCVPDSGTLPYSVQLWPQLCNDDSFSRRIHGRLDVLTADGTSYFNWKKGIVNVNPGYCYTTAFWVNLPDSPLVQGVNTFSLIGTDITAPPYNQPPYSPSGDTDVDSCTATGY